MKIFFESNMSTLWPVLAFIASMIGSFIAKEDDFDKKIQDLCQKFLLKKVAALRLLFDSIEFTATSFDETKDFQGKKFFTETDKYSNLERKILVISRVHRTIISIFHYGLAIMLLFIILSFIKLSYINLIIFIASILLFVFVIIGVITLRRIENKISNFSKMEELKY
jgi:hypothetical protein